MCLPRPKQSFFAMKSVKICRFKTSLVRIFARGTLFAFRYFSIHVINAWFVDIFCYKMGLNDM